MKENRFSWRTPLARVRGLGVSGHGSGHFIWQRSSAVVLLLLLLCLLFSGLPGAMKGGHEASLVWVSGLFNVVILILTFLFACHHMALGVRTVIEDYISGRLTRYFLLFLNNFASVGIFVLVSYCVLRVAIRGI